MLFNIQCPSCLKSYSKDDVKEIMEAYEKNESFILECECGHDFDVYVEWEPKFDQDDSCSNLECPSNFYYVVLHTPEYQEKLKFNPSKDNYMLKTCQASRFCEKWKKMEEG